MGLFSVLSELIEEADEASVSTVTEFASVPGGPNSVPTVNGLVPQT